jgi:hypothetical protein
MFGIIVTAMICVTLVVLSRGNSAAQAKLIAEQTALLCKYRDLTNRLLDALPDGTEARLGEKETPLAAEVDGGE